MGTTVEPIGLHIHAGNTISMTIIPCRHPITPFYDASQRGYEVGWDTSFPVTMCYLSHQFSIILLL